MSDAPEKWTFKKPYTVTIQKGLGEECVALEAHNMRVATFGVETWGGEQEAIEAAWHHCYSDLRPTTEQIAADSRVQRLVEALRSVTDAYKKGGMPIAQSRARAALAEFTTTTTTKETT